MGRGIVGVLPSNFGDSAQLTCLDCCVWGWVDVHVSVCAWGEQVLEV